MQCTEILQIRFANLRIQNSKLALSLIATTGFKLRLRLHIFNHKVYVPLTVSNIWLSFCKNYAITKVLIFIIFYQCWNLKIRLPRNSQTQKIRREMVLRYFTPKCTILRKEIHWYSKHQLIYSCVWFLYYYKS